MTNKSSPKTDPNIWKRMITRYTIAMFVGMGILLYLIPNIQHYNTQLVLPTMLLGGLLIFAGGFGVVVSTIFHFINKNRT